jgi:hypothetical protein
MLIENLGHAITNKTVTIEQLSKNQDGFPSYVVLGTPQLSNNEIIELYGVLKHEIKLRKI